MKSRIQKIFQIIFMFQYLCFSLKLFSAFKKSENKILRGKLKSKGIIIIFELLFDQPQLEIITIDQQDPKNRNQFLDFDEKIKSKEGKIFYLPKTKRNYYESIKQGDESSAYFFDFLDPLLQFEISYEFKRTFELAKSLSYDSKDDPYSYEKLNSYSRLYNHFNLQDKITREIWGNSITVPQIKLIINNWGWNINSYSEDKAKYFVDKYDYDGDGRLNPREFILGMIVENLNYVGGKYGCSNCLEYVISNKIDIIFKYLNYNNSSFVTAEQIWIGFKHLKRGSNSKFYSLYTCQKYKNARTVAVNDFVLKAHDAFNGKLTNRDFRLGILLGYWNRQTDEKGIYLDDEINKKNDRWTETAIDIKCESSK